MLFKNASVNLELKVSKASRRLFAMLSFSLYPRYQKPQVVDCSSSVVHHDLLLYNAYISVGSSKTVSKENFFL